MSEDNNNNKNPYDVPISGHEYDGILELDNPLPNWWLYTFFATIIFGAIYWLHYETGAGKNSDERLAHNLQKIETLRATGATDQEPINQEQILALVDNPEAMASAAKVYDFRCAVCHGPSGEGGIGAALNDGVWIHGSDTDSIYKVISEGVLDKGMPPWKDILTFEEMAQVTAYVQTFEGK